MASTFTSSPARQVISVTSVAVTVVIFTNGLIAVGNGLVTSAHWYCASSTLRVKLPPVSSEIVKVGSVRSILPCTGTPPLSRVKR